MAVNNRIVFPKLHSAQRQLNAALGPWNSGGRHAWRCGRRLGKTTNLECLGANRALHGRSVGWFAPNYKLLLPSYKHVLNMLRPAVASASKVDSLITLKTGGSIEFWTLNDEDAGRSRSYDLAILDEAGLIQKGLRDIFEQSISPTLLDRRGDAIMAGTPKGISDESFFYQACSRKVVVSDWPTIWGEQHMPTSANPTLDPVGVAALAAQYPPLVYRQEFLAEFVDWSGSAFFALESMLIGGNPIPLPTFSDAVFAVIDSATKTGREHDGTAVTYYAITKLSGLPYKLAVLDYDIVQIEGSMLETWLPTIFQTLEVLARECGARSGSIGAFIEDKASGTILLQQARRRNWLAHDIDSKLTSVGKDERGISTSGYVFRGEVKMTERAYNRMVNYKGNTKNHLISQVCGYRIGVKDGEDDLYDTFCYGVAIALGNSDGY